MKHLTKADNEQRESFVRNIKEKAESVREILEKINALITKELNPAVVEYNGVLNDSYEWRNEITGRMEDYENGRSEKWQEGEVGTAYVSWRESWEALSFETTGEFEEITFEGIDTDELEQIASQPEE
jgi:hypothetical protein